MNTTARLVAGVTWENGVALARIWAPAHRSVALLVEGNPARRIELMSDGADHFIGERLDVHAGDRYCLEVDGANSWPDWSSRFQPDGVHASSEIVDAENFSWSDADWIAPPFEELIIYELHIGAFTTEGTFRAAASRLPALVELGVNAVELMPVASFAGEHNWGYDGVGLFAPTANYGSPDDLRAFVDAAHAAGIAVLLDVVYNHLGPDGAYIGQANPQLFSSRHHTPWGNGINFDGPGSRGVRDLFIANALMWLNEYHFDGLRLDATQTILDDSNPHFLQELVATVRNAIERRVYLVAEDNRNMVDLVKQPASGGFGFDAYWADDFHHQIHRTLTGDQHGYYGSYTTDIRDLVTIICRGWLVRREAFGTARVPASSADRETLPANFVICLQNHDQVGNRPGGQRLHSEVSAPTYRAISTLLFLVPQTPLLFMGQEWGATSPFGFFTAHHDELGAKVSEGRAAEVRENYGPHFDATAILDPQDPDTFHRSKLRWTERSSTGNQELLNLYIDLIALRKRALRTLHQQRWDFDCAAMDTDSLALRYRTSETEMVVVVRIQGSGWVPVPWLIGDHAEWQLELSTEGSRYTGASQEIVVDRNSGACLFGCPGAVVVTRPLRGGFRGDT